MSTAIRNVMQSKYSEIKVIKFNFLGLGDKFDSCSLFLSGKLCSTSDSKG